MKEIIAGVLYDTETARLVGQWNNGSDKDSFGYCSEDLYQNEHGEYFIHGEGGPRSKYAVRYGNYRFWSEQIRDVTLSEAREWAKEKLTADKYQEEFAPVDEAKLSLDEMHDFIKNEKE